MSRFRFRGPHRGRSVLWSWSALAVVAAGLSRAAAVPEPPPLTLPELLHELEARSPELAARRQQVAAAAERPAQLGAFEDPTLSVELWQAPVDFSRVPLMFTLRQPIPWPGKLAARAAAARPEAQRLGAEADDTLRTLRRDVTRLYFSYRLAQRSGEVLRASQGLLGTLVAAVGIRYRIGRADLAEVLRAEEALSNLGNLLIDTERERQLAAAELNVLFARPPAEPLGSPVSVATPQELPEAGRLTAWALGHRPELAAQRAMLSASERRQAAARAERLPDLAAWVGAMAMLRGGEHTLTAGIQTSIPSFSLARSGAQQREATAELAAGRRQLEALEARIAGEVATALLRLDTARRHLSLHGQTTIPLAERAMKAALVSYQNGRTDLPLVLDAARALIEHQLEYERYSAEYGQRLGELEAALGTPLESVGAGGTR